MTEGVPRRGEARKHLARELRRRIVRGDYRPGERLPTRADLLAEFDVSTTTLQATFDVLSQQGFVRTAGKGGTFVAEAPPHLTRYAMLFPDSREHILAQAGWFRVMLTVMPAVQVEAGIELVAYFGIVPGARNEDWERLREDCEYHRVAGILFTGCPWLRDRTLVFDAPGVSKVTVGEPLGPGVPGVVLGGDEYVRIALETVAGAGRKRVAVISSPGYKLCADMRNHLAEYGLTMRPHWHVRVSTTEPETAHDAAHLLFHAGQAERPDALLIVDDTLVEHACSGVIAAGVRVPDQLTVIAHANFPLPPRPAVPVRFLGYDTVELITICVNLLESQRNGKEVPGITVIRPRLGDRTLTPTRQAARQDRETERRKERKNERPKDREAEKTERTKGRKALRPTPKSARRDHECPRAEVVE